MSPEGIDRRLRELSELYQFTTTLKDVRWLGKVEDPEQQRSDQRPGGTKKPSGWPG